MGEEKLNSRMSSFEDGKVQFRFRFFATQVPTSIPRATISVYSDSGSANDVFTKTSESFIRGGQCRWRETLRYEADFSANSAGNPHLLTFVLSQDANCEEIIGEVQVDLMELSEAGNGMLEQRALLIETEYGNITLNVTVQCSKMPSATSVQINQIPAMKKKGSVTLLRTVSGESFPMADVRVTSGESSQSRDSKSSPDSSTVLPTVLPNHLEPLDTPIRHHSLEMDAEAAAVTPTLPRRSGGSGKLVSRPLRAKSVPVRFIPPGLEVKNEMLPIDVLELRGQLKKAEEAIDELQSESVVWRKASRNLSKEVENLRQQLSEAMKQDQIAELEIQALTEERDYLSSELEKSQADVEAMDSEIFELRERLKEIESELVLQKACTAKLTLEAKTRENSTVSSPKSNILISEAIPDSEEYSELNKSTTMKSDIQEAIEAIDELQAESVTWQTTSRSLSKEVEYLRKHLDDAVRNDQEADAEIQVLLQERDLVREELESEKDNHQLTKTTVRMLEEEVSLQKEMIHVLMVQVKALHASNQRTSQSPRDGQGPSNLDSSKLYYQRGVGLHKAM